MVRLDDIVPGDKIRIVDRWRPRCYESPMGKMDKYLGEIMTVKGLVRVNGSVDCVRCEEGQQDNYGAGWDWYPAAIAEIMKEEVTEDEPEVTEDEVLLLYRELAGEHAKFGEA